MTEGLTYEEIQRIGPSAVLAVNNWNDKLPLWVLVYCGGAKMYYARRISTGRFQQQPGPEKPKW